MIKSCVNRLPKSEFCLRNFLCVFAVFCIFLLVFNFKLFTYEKVSNTVVKPEVIFDFSSINKIFQQPELVVADVKKFWQTEGAYIAAKKWEPPGYPIHYREFERQVKLLVSQDQSERNRNPYHIFANEILETVPDFNVKGLNHVMSYLPEDSVLKAKVHFACFIYLGKEEPKFSPTAFVVEDRIVFNISHKYWKFKTAEILHLLTHELVHVAFHQFHKTLPLQEADTTQKLIDHILWQLHNEGMATYVAYRVQPILPTEDERDYLLLENPEEVKRSFFNVNLLLHDAKTHQPDKIHQKVIERGISKRAFYVAGAYMAQQIENKQGKITLVDAFSKSPTFFAKLYNSQAVPDLKIRGIK